MNTVTTRHILRSVLRIGNGCQRTRKVGEASRSHVDWSDNFLVGTNALHETTNFHMASNIVLQFCSGTDVDQNDNAIVPQPSCFTAHFQKPCYNTNVILLLAPANLKGTRDISRATKEINYWKLYRVRNIQSVAIKM
jgi:hypothetical protein